MKLATETTTVSLAELSKEAAHDANFEVLQLQRKRAIYATTYQRMQEVLHLDDEGYEVSITLRSHSKTLTLTAAEGAQCFDSGELYTCIGGQLRALQAQILQILQRVEDGQPLGSQEGTDTPQMHQVLALCMPQVAAPTTVTAHASSLAA